MASFGGAPGSVGGVLNPASIPSLDLQINNQSKKLKGLNIEFSRDGKHLAITTESGAFIVPAIEGLVAEHIAAYKKQQSATTSTAASAQREAASPVTSTAPPANATENVKGSTSNGSAAAKKVEKPPTNGSSPLRIDQKICELKGHTGAVTGLSWAPLAEINNVNGKYNFLTTCGIDGTVKIWDLRSLESKSTEYKPVVDIKTGAANKHVCWSPCGRYIAVAGKNDTITFLEVENKSTGAGQSNGGSNGNNGNDKGSRQNNNNSNNNNSIYSKAKIAFNIEKGGLVEDEIIQFAWNNASDIFFITTSTGEVSVYSFKDLIQFALEKARKKDGRKTELGHLLLGKAELNGNLKSASFLAHMGACSNITMDTKGWRFATGGTDATVNVWDCETLLCARTVSRLETPIRDVSLSTDGRYIASCSDDKMIDITNIDSGDVAKQLTLEEIPHGITWSPLKSTLAYIYENTQKFTIGIKLI